MAKNVAISPRITTLKQALEAGDGSSLDALYNGGHEYLCWRGTLADGLLALIGL